GRGTNHDTYEEYRTQLEEIAKPFYTFPSNVDELGKQLTPYIQGTPLMGIDLESYFRELRAIELQRRKQKIEAGWDYDLDPQVIHHNAVLEFCAEIAAWKTPTGKALQTKLGFSHMHSFPLLMFSRDVSVALERERRLKTLESLTP
ncbi:hypothetical protein KC721_03720, partial [Candidatus Woesebacteria bacterium]|nr:hypothetical protein [Candidatus Woesebacteria bacterium]